ncbi:hypothetical protein [Methylobacterium brachythecii]|uniref:Uncharacterized protein n=1 Tax=Methylobacterium brachythecii TaxID=1176177 RepID=A0A7W6AKI4_9HYPH|nr:hypothetical protein [Methylobacterium brachythecii]MBB3905138.1 hypothetical protein [Methylobacterium brachythecii]GLS44355.1 hypothetical protein GCM10007884_23430 [Methylobacterium brachythecii]
MRRSLLALLALASLSDAAWAQTYTLPEIGLQNIGSCRQFAVRDRTSTTMVPLGCFDTTKQTFQLAPVAQPASGAFFTTFNSAVGAQYGIPTPSKVGAKVNRVNDRLLVGAATANSGDFPATTKDWYEQLEAGTTHPIGFRTSWAQTASISTNGGIGVLGAARTSDINLPTFQLAMGGLFATNNDNTTNQQLATAMYAVAFRQPGAGIGAYTGTVGAEIDIANLGNSVQLLPSNVDSPAGHTTALKLNSGAVVPGATTASAALTIGNNGAKFLTGIVMAQTAIAGLTYDGSGNVTGGGASAMRMSVFQTLEWFNTQAGSPSSVITSEILTPANGQSIRFRDAGTFIGDATGNIPLLLIPYIGGTQTAAGVVQAGQASTPTAFAASPLSGSNADVALRSAGTGKLVLGNASSDYVTVTSAGASTNRVTIGSNGTPAAASMTKTAALGTVIQGATGTNSDLNILSAAGSSVLAVPTGTTTVVFSGAIQLPNVTVATLPTCNAAAKGTLVSLTDFNGAPTWNGPIAGGNAGGSQVILAFCTGSAWTQH